MFKAAETYCPYSCGICPPSHTTGQLCDRLIIRLVSQLTVADIRADIDGIDVWERLLSKAGFENELTTGLGGIEQIATNDVGAWSDNMKNLKRPVANPSGTTQFQVLASSETSVVTEFSNDPVNVVWLLMTLVASCCIAGSMAFKAFTSGTTAGSLSAALQGFTFELEVADQENEPHEVSLCGDGLKMATPFIRAVIQVGSLVAEAALPTHMCYASWLAVDMVSIATAERVMMVVFPRVSSIFITEVLKDTFHFEASITFFLVFVSVTALGSGISLSVIVDRSLDGNPDDFLYWLVPIIIQVSMVTLAFFIIMALYYESQPAGWATLARLRCKTSTKLEEIALKLRAPHTFHIALMIEPLCSKTTDYIYAHSTLVQWNEGPQSEKVYALAMDTLEEDRTRTRLVPSDTVAHAREAGFLTACCLGVRRMPARGGNEEGTDCGMVVDLLG